MYQSSYTWPNQHFPFRVYYENTKLRVFIIENMHHNWQWLSKYKEKIRPTDLFLVYCGWFHGDEFAKEATLMCDDLGIDKNRFIFLYNSSQEMNVFTKHGFMGRLIPHNCWLDDKVIYPRTVKKTYRAIYVGRRSAFKRHMLAEKVEHLAIVAGANHGNAVSDIPSTAYINSIKLSTADVCTKISESYCGLILSELEGGCFSSSEYLLCGIPVVSTPSLGGRDVWYTEYNSIISDPNPDAIADAVDYFNRNVRSPEKIRNHHIQLSNKFREEFIAMLGEIFLENNVQEDARRYFNANFFHKMRESIKPDFDRIFT